MKAGAARALSGVSAAAMILAGFAAAGTASADATENFPIPNRMLHTTCTAEQIMAAARDVAPVYYKRYMIDYNNKSPQIHQAVQDRINWFYAMDYPGRRSYAENLATDIYYEKLTFAWPNWSKLFFNNRGVASRTTDVCEQYPADDLGVWTWA
ncbi:DUF5078 domain-containing protein [[Mycobacterium] nativiensis]|uniref:DUF5078 domain-containing protein n=1 Tax=[Mycobacterium] nativiensis TaxID=2855503 RepID=A0ABU5Y069_9MYCO|nr:DUF5078 domain-containing protein [Mycolicibacter sp. MYC340]MEB3033603.1 DUF5078 domain-containing protein [Mycolicibacter sp. MYC340]